MDRSLNIITAVWYTTLKSVQSYNFNLSGSVKLEVTEWEPVNFIKGSPGFTIEDGYTKSGKQFTSSLSINLKESFPDPGPVMIRIEFQSGNILIIGDPDLPVRFETSESLLQKNLKISHKSWHYPYKLIQ